VDFALLTVVWVPLVLGTLAIGTTMIRGLQTIQVARDTGHMYALGVDFSLSGNQSMVAWLGQDLGMAVTGGKGVVILSTVSYVGRYQCQAAGVADNATPPNPTAGCTNYQHFVFTHRLTIGKSSLRASSFGNPDASLVASSGYLTRDDYVKKAGARADRFTLLSKPKEDGTDGFQAGQFAYLVEAYFQAPPFPGFLANPGTYADAIF
jgi:hypothetical protein